MKTLICIYTHTHFSCWACFLSVLTCLWTAVLQVYGGYLASLLLGAEDSPFIKQQVSPDKKLWSTDVAVLQVFMVLRQHWWFHLLKKKCSSMLFYLTLCEKVIARLSYLINKFNQPNSIDCWVQFHYPHPGMITARPAKPKHHLNRTCLECEAARKSQKAAHDATI